jgi:hypothetical protein
MALRIPGVLVRIINDTGIIAPPLFERYPVIIGEGDPYRLIEDMELTRTIGSVDPIPSTTTVNSIVSAGDLPGIASYIDGTDYTLSSSNRISWLPGGSSPTVGDNYYLSWTETRPTSAYTPTLYFDANLIYQDHGSGVRTNGDINDVSVGGALALDAGSAGVIIAQIDLSSATDPDTPTASELEAAFIATRNQLNQITDYKLFLIPMSSGTINTTTAAAIFFNHAVIASQPENKQERTVIAALPIGTTYTAAATYAQGYAHERMVVPYLKNATVTVTGYSGTYDTRFYNAALAGVLCAVPIARTIADEIIPGITFTDNLIPAEQKYLVQRGVSPAKIRGEVVRNVMAITTDTTNALTEDLGVQDTKDYVKKYWREGLWNNFRNAPINNALLGTMTTASLGIMRDLQDRNIIAAFSNISVRQDTSEPRKINITGKVQPAYGTTWIDVTFTFVLTFA